MSASNRPPRVRAYRVIGAGLAAVALLLSITASSLAATTPQGWHRLNLHKRPRRARAVQVPGRRRLALPLQQAARAQSRLRLGPDPWHIRRCRDDGRLGVPDVGSRPKVGHAADTVVSGTAEFTFPRHSGGFTLSQQLLVGDNGDLELTGATTSSSSARGTARSPGRRPKTRSARSCKTTPQQAGLLGQSATDAPAGRGRARKRHARRPSRRSARAIILRRREDSQRGDPPLVANGPDGEPEANPEQSAGEPGTGAEAVRRPRRPRHRRRDA